jgi:hypothetical protein
MEMGMVTATRWVELYKISVLGAAAREYYWSSHDWNLGISKVEANSQFGKFIERNYEDWFEPKADKPVLSHNLLRNSTSWIKEKRQTYFVCRDW